jgi:peptidoglycan/LPS O-acetylase OafA/YrhL
MNFSSQKQFAAVLAIVALGLAIAAQVKQDKQTTENDIKLYTRTNTLSVFFLLVAIFLCVCLDISKMSIMSIDWLVALVGVALAITAQVKQDKAVQNLTNTKKLYMRTNTLSVLFLLVAIFLNVCEVK